MERFEFLDVELAPPFLVGRVPLKQRKYFLSYLVPILDPLRERHIRAERSLGIALQDSYPIGFLDYKLSDQQLKIKDIYVLGGIIEDHVITKRIVGISLGYLRLKHPTSTKISLSIPNYSLDDALREITEQNGFKRVLSRRYSSSFVKKTYDVVAIA